MNEYTAYFRFIHAIGRLSLGAGIIFFAVSVYVLIGSALSQFFGWNFVDRTELGLELFVVSIFLLLLAAMIAGHLDVSEDRQTRREARLRELAEGYGLNEFQRKQMEVNNDQWLHADAPPPIGGKQEE